MNVTATAHAPLARVVVAPLLAAAVATSTTYVTGGTGVAELLEAGSPAAVRYVATVGMVGVLLGAGYAAARAYWTDVTKHGLRLAEAGVVLALWVVAAGLLAGYQSPALSLGVPAAVLAAGFVGGDLPQPGRGVRTFLADVRSAISGFAQTAF